MLTLHLGFWQQEFIFWAETHPTVKLSEQHYPFQASQEQLRKSLRQLNLSRQPEQLKQQQLWFWVPSTTVPSSSGNALAESTTLQPYLLETIILPPGKVIQWLGQPYDLPSEVITSAEIPIWQALWQTGMDLIARHQILPDLEQRQREWFALWRPLLSQSEHQQLRRLTQFMPASCQAFSEQMQNGPTEQMQTLLMTALTRLCDTQIRLKAIGGQYSPRRIPSMRLEDRWLEALRRRNGLVQGSEPELLLLERRLSAWSRSQRLLADAPFQLVFQLEEPSETSEQWYLRYLLHSREDPSLYIDLETLEQPHDLAVLKHFPLRSFLREALGQAHQHCPALEQNLDGGQELSLIDVESFLSASEALGQAGFGLRLPVWWKQEQSHLRARVQIDSAPTSSGGHLSLNKLLNTRWELMLGDEPISIEELQILAQQKSRLIFWRNRWVHLNPDELNQALAYWQQHQAHKFSLKDVLLLGPQGEGAPIVIEEVRTNGWLKEFLATLRHEQEVPTIPLPEGFHGVLRPYQQRGLDWLGFLCSNQLGACLADDMGLGKTIQTLALMQSFIEQGVTGQVLLICPTSLLDNWRHEARRFVPTLRTLIHHGTQRCKAEDFASQIKDYDLIISSYALLHRDQESFQDVIWNGVVLDEAQNIKNAQTKQSKVARALSAHWKLILTGTPVENHVGDLWSLMDFLNPGLLGTPKRFKTQFLTPIQRWQDTRALQRLQHLTSPFILRRLKTDPEILPDLPEKLEMKVYCQLSQEQATLYASVVQDIELQLNTLSGIQRRGVVLAALMRLKQICNHPAHFLKTSDQLSDRSGKLDRMEEMLGEIFENQEKALIFSQFSEMGKLLQSHLQKRFQREVLFLYGGTPAAARSKMVERFQNDDSIPIFVLSLKAGGTGLNLTAANHVFHYDRWWNPAVENQATDRAYRIGQEKQVQVHKLICSGTLEERIDDLLEEKKNLADTIVGSGENWITEMNDQELKELFKLSSDLVLSS